MRLGEIYCGRSGAGRWACPCAVQWGEACGKSERTCQENRTARVLICVCQAHLVALHGFIKKTRATPDDDLALARKRLKELRQ